MLISEISAFELSKKAQETIEDRDQYLSVAQQLKITINRLKDDLCNINGQISQQKQRLELFKDAQFVIACLRLDAFSMRRKLLALRLEAKREDITVAESKKLTGAVVELEKKLQKECPHPLVVYVSGYKGSSGYDYDDSKVGEHTCMVCGLHKYDEDTDGTNLIFTKNGQRLFKRIYFEDAKNDIRACLAKYEKMESAEEVVSQFFGHARLKTLAQLIRSNSE